MLFIKIVFSKTSWALQEKEMLNVAFRASSLIWYPAIVCATAFLSVSAFAIDSKHQMTGAGFSNACTQADESWVSFCNGYIQAVIDSIREADKVCLPKGGTRTDVVTVAEREITASSQLRAMNAHDAVLSVLRRFYPCR
jgi:hypothetical protein